MIPQRPNSPSVREAGTSIPGGCLARPYRLETWELHEVWPWPLLVGFGLFLFYAACAPRTVALEDDGLFILASYFNGIAHPPGYPVFTLLGHLFSQLPLGSEAWRVHLVSALFGGLGCAVLWCVVRDLVPSRTIATGASLALGFSGAYWSQSIIAEVYTLNVFITLLLVWMVLRLAGRPDRHVGWCGATLLGLVYGIGLSNHWPLLVLFSPAYLLLAWPVLMPLLRRLPALLIGLAAGLLPYLWLYLRSHMDPEISFFGPIEGLSEFLQFVSRSTYGGADHEAGAGLGDKLGYLRYQGQALVDQFTPLGAILAALGLVAPGRHRRIVLALLAGALCVSVLLIALLDRDFTRLGIFVYRVYPIPAYVVAAICLALGLERLWGWSSRLPTPAVVNAVRSGAVLAVAALPLMVHFPVNYRADYSWAERYARAVLDEVPPGGILLLMGDIDALPIGYVRLVRGYRDDVEVYGAKGLLFRNRPFDPWQVRQESAKREALRRLVEESGRPVCFNGIRGHLGDDLGLTWHGLVSCYDTTRREVYSRVSSAAIERYIALQSARDADDWTMMAADSLDGQMVHVLITESFRSDQASRPRLHEAIDRARFGLRGKTAFIRYSLDAGVPLTTEESLALLEEAHHHVDAAYTKQDLIDLFRLTARELERAGRAEEALETLWDAVEVKPEWRNDALPELLKRLFREGREGQVRALARLDPDLAVLPEVYDYYANNREDEGFALKLERAGLEIKLAANGEFSIR